MKAKTNPDIQTLLFGIWAFFIALFKVGVTYLLSTDCLAAPFQKHCQDLMSPVPRNGNE